MEESKLYDTFIRNVTDIPKFKLLFDEETDRGCALLAASLLDFELKNLLVKHFIADTRLSKKIFSPNGPLGTFSSKIDIAFTLGLISRRDYIRIHKIREIRNDFGHSFDSKNFSLIVDKIYSIGLDIHSKKDDARTIFIDTVSQLLIKIYVEVYVSDRIVNELEHNEMNPNNFIASKTMELKLPPKKREKNKYKK